MLRYAITDGSSTCSKTAWIKRVAEWLAAGIELIQIREKDLTAKELFDLVQQVMTLPNLFGSRVLVNDRADVALAGGADGVHLRAGSVQPRRLRSILPPKFVIAVSCHDESEISAAAGADYIVVAPVFRPLSKKDTRQPLGIKGLTQMVKAAPAPVLALGGVTFQNAENCLAAGASGIAGISNFAR